MEAKRRDENRRGGDIGEEKVRGEGRRDRKVKRRTEERKNERREKED